MIILLLFSHEELPSTCAAAAILLNINIITLNIDDTAYEPGDIYYFVKERVDTYMILLRRTILYSDTYAAPHRYMLRAEPDIDIII